MTGAELTAAGVEEESADEAADGIELAAGDAPDAALPAISAAARAAGEENASLSAAEAAAEQVAAEKTTVAQNAILALRAKRIAAARGLRGREIKSGRGGGRAPCVRRYSTDDAAYTAEAFEVRRAARRAGGGWGVVRSASGDRLDVTPGKRVRCAALTAWHARLLACCYARHVATDPTSPAMALCQCKPCDRCATCQSFCTHARNALTSLTAGTLPAAGARGGERKQLARAAAQRHEPPCDRTYVRYKCDFATGLPTWVMERSPPRAPAPRARAQFPQRERTWASPPSVPRWPPPAV